MLHMAGTKTTMAYFIGPSSFGFKKLQCIIKESSNKKSIKLFVPDICPNIFHMGYRPNTYSKTVNCLLPAYLE